MQACISVCVCVHMFCFHAGTQAPAVNEKHDQGRGLHPGEFGNLIAGDARDPGELIVCGSIGEGVWA